jgi:hypothetical protein
MCTEGRSIIPSFSAPLSFSTQLLGPSQGALQDRAASGFRILQLSTSSFCCARAQKRLCTQVRYVEPTSPLNQVLMPMARSRRGLSCAPRVLALFGELWQTFSWVASKRLCTRQVCRAQIYIGSITNIIGKISASPVLYDTSTRCPALQRALADGFLEHSKQLSHLCTSSSDSSGRPLPGTFQAAPSSAPVLRRAPVYGSLERSNGFRCCYPASAPLATLLDLLLYML